MAQYINKSDVVAEIERLINSHKPLKTLDPTYCEGLDDSLDDILSFIDTLEVIDPYEQCIQYPSVKDGIQAHAETYSFNIESQLFPQLTKEQQKLWRKEIEQACISGGNAGVELTRDQRYKENLKAKKVDLEKEATEFVQTKEFVESKESPILLIAEHFFELGLNAKNKNIWHPMSELPDHSCSVLMHGYGNDVWIADAMETLEQSNAQEWAYIDDVLKTLGLKVQKGE